MAFRSLCERRMSLWAVLVFIAITYGISSVWYICLYIVANTETTIHILHPNSTWWRTDQSPYNMSLIDEEYDFGRLVDIPDFRFLINNKRCDGDSSVFLLVFVHSAATNFRKRQVIRRTWGKESNLPRDPMRIIFLLGTVTDPEDQYKIEAENRAHHDIIQGNFIDSYRNLTYKHIMGLKWVTYYCRQARFVFKTDDDIFVDIFQLASFLDDTFGRSGHVGNLMMCYLVRSPGVKRSQRSKWRVSFREYPGRRYPTYCSGWSVLMSPDVVFRLYLLSSKVPFFWVDDVHVTGTLAKKAGILHVDFAEKLSLTEVDVDKWLNSRGDVKPYLFGPPDSDEAMIFALWNKTMQHYHKPFLQHR